MMSNLKRKKSNFTLLAFLLMISQSLLGQQNNRTIVADYSKALGPKSTVFNECVGAGRANEGLRADWQQQLAVAKKEIGFKYIRFHGLLHDDMRVYALDKEGKVIYNWQYIDRLFDYLLSIKMKPFVEFGFMPSDLASGTKTIFWWKANVSKPKSYPEWNSLILALVTHWKERYGLAEIKTWYYEVWNEPDLRGFFDGTQDDYFELYNNTVKTVKAVSPELKVGGPATSATKWIADFLAYSTKNNLPVDFVSTHDYGTTSVLDELGTKKQILKDNPDTISVNVKRIEGLIKNSIYKNAELHFTEWNTSPSSRDPLHDTYQNAAYILNALKNIDNHANSMSYWTFTDIFEEAGPAQSAFHGGFGLFNLQDIKKPTYYVYKFLNELGDTELISNDSKSFTCKSKNGIQMLIWDYTRPAANYKNDQTYFSQLQAPDKNQKVSIQVKNVPNGKYQVQIYQVGFKHNDPYTTYLEMGKPAQLSIKQVADLKKLSEGKPEKTFMASITNGNYKNEINLSSNEIYFIKLEKL